MKHAVSNKKPPVKPRPIAGKAVLKSPVKSVKTIEKKSKVISSKNAIDVETAKKMATKKTVQSVKPPIKKIAPAKPLKKTQVIIFETPKPKIQKAKNKKVEIVKAVAKTAKNNQPMVSGKNIKAKATKIKKIKAVFPAKTVKAENQKSKRVATTKKVKISTAEKTSTVLKSSAKVPPKKVQSAIVGKTAKRQIIVPIVKAKPAIKQVKAVAAIKKSNVKTVGKPKSVVVVKKVKVGENKTKPKNLPATQILKKVKVKPVISAKENKITAKVKTRKIAPVVQIKKPKVAENKVEEITAARPVKPKNKKAKPLSSAVFRGKKERYDFKVFALNEIFEAIPAVYIISKRTTDKRKKGHHALICIGATDSIADELKKHRKAKCVKKHAANVVSILPEANEKIRLKIETDLKAAHTVACNLD